MDTENKKVWFVTGTSKGLGLALVKQLLSRGDQVAATTRSIEQLSDAVGNTGENFLPLAVDLQSESSVAEAIEETVKTFGKIDVVVNNAGFGLTGGIEELSDKEARDNFDVNVFGTLNVLRKALPHLRRQQSGHIINISSIGGFTGLFPGFGVYCATKFAVQGLTESLAAEVKDFGIYVTVVSPGYFRTSFLTDDSLRVPQHPIDAYRAVRESQHAHQHSINGNQPNDPEKGAAAIIGLVGSENPPLHLFLGQDSYGLAEDKIELVKRDMDEWKEVGTGVAF